MLYLGVGPAGAQIDDQKRVALVQASLEHVALEIERDRLRTGVAHKAAHGASVAGKIKLGMATLQPVRVTIKMYDQRPAKKGAQAAYAFRDEPAKVRASLEGII